MAGMTDPILLANWIQQVVDSATGRHVDLIFIQILANTISSIDLASIILNVFFVILIALLTRAAARIVDRMLANHIPRVVSKVQMKMDETMQLMMRRLVSATIYVIGLMLIIYQIPQLRSLVTAILAGASIAGLAIGFAAKDSLSNFTSSIFIAIFQPIRVGDLVDFRGEYGQVEDLTLRHTVIRTTDNKRIIVPNSIISNEPIINWSIRDPEISWVVDFDLEKDSSLNLYFYPGFDRDNKWMSTALWFKRALDIVGGITGLILFFPCFILISALIKITSPGPVFFRQKRLGFHGKPFMFLKFRTMTVNNDASIHRDYIKSLIKNNLPAQTAASSDGDDQVYKIANDPRVTRFGGFLRKTSLDEIPQFINVLKGEMSLIGPRPPIPYEFDHYQLWHRRRVMEVKPGITGLWQVKGRSRCNFDETVRLDLQYIREWSLWLDIKILFQTPWAMIAGKGGY